MYKPDFNFQEGSKDYYGQKLDIEFVAVAREISALYQKFSEVFNDDGTLKPGRVDAKALGVDISLAPSAATPWTSGQKYKANQIVYHEHAVYWCAQKHESVSFKTDADKWVLLLDFGPYISLADKLGRNAHVVRVSENIDSIQSVSKQTAKIIELANNLAPLTVLAAKIPQLDKLIAADDGDLLPSLYESITELKTLTGSLEYVKLLCTVIADIKTAAAMSSSLTQVITSSEDIKLVAQYIRQIKGIAEAQKEITG